MIMLTARIEFTAEAAPHFCPEPDQQVTEVLFESVDALIETLKEIERDVVNCTVAIDGKVFDLRNISGHPKPEASETVA